MAAKIKADVVKALSDWNAGKPVKSIELGHVHRMTHTEEMMQSYPNVRPQIDLSKRISNDQDRAHAYCFALIHLAIDAFKLAGTFVSDVAFDHSSFVETAQSLRAEHFPEVTTEEATAAESLAWKALHIGWARAIAGHAPEMYIEVTNPEVAAASSASNEVQAT